MNLNEEKKNRERPSEMQKTYRHGKTNIYEKYVFETTFRITRIIVRSIIQKIIEFRCDSFCFFFFLSTDCRADDEVKINTYQHIIKMRLIFSHNLN